MISEIVEFSLMDCKISNKKQDVDLDKESIFGQRFLNDETRVFEYNAWDDVDWPDEKEKEIKNTIELQQSHPVDDEIVADLLDTPNKQWETFYLSHGNKFFMNRKWVIREFSELFSEVSTIFQCRLKNSRSEVCYRWADSHFGCWLRSRKHYNSNYSGNK